MSEFWVVYSDMDGTLLGHRDYRYHVALPAIERLRALHIPLILNTSKTFAELRSWVSRLQLQQPFVVENGSTVYFPENYFGDSQRIPDSSRVDGFEKIAFGPSLDELQDFIAQTRPAAVDFTSCSLDQAQQLCGLDPESLVQARTRENTIPLRFEHEDALQQFREQAEKAGFRLLEGGRFFHLMGKTDKAQAMQRVNQLYAERMGACAVFSAALGDSPNDEAMLRAARIAVVVDSPTSHRLAFEHDCLLRTRQSAPEGWQEGIDFILKQIQLSKPQTANLNRNSA